VHTQVEALVLIDAAEGHTDGADHVVKETARQVVLVIEAALLGVVHALAVGPPAQRREIAHRATEASA
jgi:hypothetical protein